MENIFLYILAVVINYLLGSIPFAYMIAIKVIKKDIRQVGSGNVGATNVYRTCGMVWGIIVFFLDAGKGWLGVFISRMIISPERFTIIKPGLTISNEVILLTAVVWVVVGHIFPIFLGFNGGKGVATACGMFIGLHAKAMEATMVVWLVVTAASRYVSLGTLVSATIFPILVFAWKTDANKSHAIFIFSLLCSIIVFVTHIPNIKRILSGEELRIGERPD